MCGILVRSIFEFLSQSEIMLSAFPPEKNDPEIKICVLKSF
jgi:hypothetical protein